MSGAIRGAKSFHLSHLPFSAHVQKISQTCGLRWFEIEFSRPDLHTSKKYSSDDTLNNKLIKIQIAKANPVQSRAYNLDGDGDGLRNAAGRRDINGGRELQDLLVIVTRSRLGT